MCTYTDVLYLCGCCGPPICATSCSQIMSELDRINHPEAWEGEALTQLPFDMADECVPNWHNAILVREATVCDHYLGDGCLPEQTVPAWLASNIALPEQTPEWIESNVEMLDFNAELLGFGVDWPEDNAERLGYNLDLPEYYMYSAWPEHGAARPEYGPPWSTYDPTYD